MSRTVYRVSIVLHAAWILAASPAPAAAQSAAGGDHEDRWIPSLALVLGFTTQKQNGSVSSSQLIGASPGPVLRSFADNVRYSNSPEVGGSLELLTPTLPLPLRPRLFVAGEILNVSAQRRNLAVEGDPTGLAEPEGITVFPPESILGQGSTTLADLDTALYGASIGFSIPLQIGDWQLSIKPSARYIHRRATFTGKVFHAFRPVDTGPTRAVQLRGNDSLDVHAIGPALEIEIDTVRISSLAASVYVSGGGYRMLSDRTISFSNTALDSLGQSTYRAIWKADLDEWIYRADVGLRVKWLGLPSGWLGGGK